MKKHLAFSTIANYGIDELNTPDKLVTKEDAQLAVEHAECYMNIAEDLLIWRESEERK